MSRLSTLLPLTPHGFIASPYVLCKQLSAGRNPRGSASERVPFEVAESTKSLHEPSTRASDVTHGLFFWFYAKVL
jgi:hypothetical protein